MSSSRCSRSRIRCSGLPQRRPGRELLHALPSEFEPVLDRLEEPAREFEKPVISSRPSGVSAETAADGVSAR